jgi:putative ABC transport system permease protein
MLLLVVLKVALKSLLANKLRSFLAMLGIIIGVGAVISMLALGAGARKQVLQRISAMGTNLLVLRPGMRGTGGVMSGTQQNMTLEDAQALLKEVPDIQTISPVVGGSAQLKYMNKNSRTNYIGTAPSYFTARNFEVEHGRPFNENESEHMARVAVIGPVTAENLFGASEAVGETLKLNGINFQVVGVLKSKGDQGYFNPDDQVLIPYTMAMKQLLGQDYLREVDVMAVEDADLSRVQENVTAVLRKRHRLQTGAPDDFNIRNQADMIQTATDTNRTFTILLGSIAGISLMVGGIGIMNIMLVTVTERTREIGVRKAIGAKDRDILRQFLLEAIVMSGLGGLLGMGAGIGTARLIPQMFTQFTTVVEPSSVVLSLLFSAAVGIFFGYYPARRAAQLDPIEALRYE